MTEAPKPREFDERAAHAQADLVSSDNDCQDINGEAYDYFLKGCRWQFEQDSSAYLAEKEARERAEADDKKTQAALEHVRGLLDEMTDERDNITSALSLAKQELYIRDTDSQRDGQRRADYWREFDGERAKLRAERQLLVDALKSARSIFAELGGLNDREFVLVITAMANIDGALKKAGEL